MMTRIGRRLGALALLSVVAAAWPLAAGASPEGQVTSLQAVSIAPRWFDPYPDIEGLIREQGAESALGLITNMAGSAPYEDIRLKGK